MTARPNLLFLLSDQHAQRIAGCYGESLLVTPALDALAGRGVIFDNAYCASPVCVPSRMSLLTATHPHRQQVWTNDDVLASDRPTWAHALGAAGYRPTLIGRLHALGPDQLHGFLHREVGDHSPNWPGVPRHDLGVLSRANDPWPESIARSGPGRSSYEAKDEEVADFACAFLKETAAAGALPFALHVGFILPHPPYVCGAEDYRRFAGRVGPPARGIPADEHPWLRWWREDRGLATAAPAHILRARTAYYGLVASMDRMIGRILETLAATGLARDTLVIYASDHGDHLGERGLFWKHTLHEESVRVPLILSHPGHLPEGERRAGVVNLIDLGPTIIEALGAPALPNTDGRSFLALARDGAAPWLDETSSEYCTDAVPDWTGGAAVQQRMLRSGRWKLCWYAGYRPQLFDLETDPGETRDLASDSFVTSLRDQLATRVLASWDPAAIRARMAARRADKDLLAAWARAASPPSEHLWRLAPEQNRLDPTNR
ncbi:MAG: sulfatase-like hydrolase/transferase [Rhodospirillales bacterium]|nr:sulfatase-like hydrolase/transferase [Rhodospirillales bacterium]